MKELGEVAHRDVDAAQGACLAEKVAWRNLLIPTRSSVTWPVSRYELGDWLCGHGAFPSAAFHQELGVDPGTRWRLSS